MSDNQANTEEAACPVLEALTMQIWEQICERAYMHVRIRRCQMSSLLIIKQKPHINYTITSLVLWGLSSLNTQVEAMCACCVPAQQSRLRRLLSPHCERHVVHPSLTDVPPCISLQIVAAILAIAGIVMMTYADGFHSHSVIGITFVVASASMSALYKVFCLHLINGALLLQ